MISKRQRKVISFFLLFAMVLTTLHYTKQPSDAERDPNTERVVVGVVTIVAGLYMAGSEALDLNPAGVVIGIGIAASGCYVLSGGYESSSSGYCSDDSELLGGDQPGQAEYDAFGHSTYH